jgi:hypothetical protein
MRRNAFLASAVSLAVSATAFAQAAASVSQVVMSSIMTTRPITATNGVTPSVSGTLPSSLLTVYTYTGQAGTVAANNAAGLLTNPSNYSAGNVAALNSALSSNIALSLSLIPLESPTSGVILKSDPLTGASLPVSSTLGPIFTQRAETIGKGKFYLGFTHQNYHFTSLNGQSLNGLPVLYSGGNQSHLLDKDGVTPLVTSPATVNFGMDIRIAQDVAFITYGVTNKLDVSVGLPMVHAAVSASAYNGLIYSGTGFGATNGKCWCVATFSPGAFALTAPAIGQSSMGKTGYGDTIVRVKNIILERPNAVLAAGVDLRFGTGDESNYLGTGTTSVKPFLALSLYSKPLARGIIFAPHAQLGWQYSGKSSLGGTLQGQTQSVSVSTSNVPIVTGPLSVVGKDYLPDVLSWSVGTEVAFGRRNTIVADILGNQIGYVHGVPTVQMTSVDGLSPIDPVNAAVKATGFAAGPKTSLGQYSGAFGYKTRLFGNLVATFQMLVRFDDNGLTARAVPLYGLGYSF